MGGWVVGSKKKSITVHTSAFKSILLEENKKIHRVSARFNSISQTVVFFCFIVGIFQGKCNENRIPVRKASSYLRKASIIAVPHDKTFFSFFMS